MIIQFPWPPKELSPNARVHWARKHRIASEYKEDCGWCLVDSGNDVDGPLVIIITFRPPSNRRADLDNMLAAFKYGIDAISDYTGVDDSDFSLVITKGEPIKGGAVEVEIQPWRAIKPVKVAA